MLTLFPGDSAVGKGGIGVTDLRPLWRQLLEMSSPVDFAQRIGFLPDPWQANLMNSSNKRIVVCCARQTGKSTTVALMANHVAANQPGSLVLVVAPAFRQSLNLFRIVLSVARQDKAYPERLRENQTEMELINGSRIVALPGKDETIRSYSGVSLLLIDEAAFVADRIFHAVRPMVSVSGGTIILLSTPRAKGGFFHTAWSDSQSGGFWEGYRVTAHDCPRLPGSEIEEAQNSMPEFAFRREYLAEFTDPEDALLRYDDITAAFVTGARPLYSSSLIDKKITKLKLVDANIRPLKVGNDG